jgi:hypothetical protein
MADAGPKTPLSTVVDVPFKKAFLRDPPEEPTLVVHPSS